MYGGVYSKRHPHADLVWLEILSGRLSRGVAENLPHESAKHLADGGGSHSAPVLCETQPGCTGHVRGNRIWGFAPPRTATCAAAVSCSRMFPRWAGERAFMTCCARRPDGPAAESRGKLRSAFLDHLRQDLNGHGQLGRGRACRWWRLWVQRAKTMRILVGLVAHASGEQGCSGLAVEPLCGKCHCAMNPLLL